MKLNRIDLDKVDLSRNRAHIERHILGHASKGSKFASWVVDFDGVLSCVRTAIAWINVMDGIRNVPRKCRRIEADGHVKVQVNLQFKIPVGTQGVVKISDLPIGTLVTRELRGAGEDAYEVNVVRITPQETNAIVLDFFNEDDGRGWYLYTAFPGILTPPFQDKEFWDRHAFIDSP